MNEHEVMLTSILNCRRIDLANGLQKMTPAQESRFKQMKTRREKGEPLQYIIGQCDFMDAILNVDERVLIPRPETEILVDIAIQKIKGLPANEQIKGLDLGAGSGNITIALLKNIGNARMTAIDISQQALSLARKNAVANQVDGRAEFLLGDMSHYLKKAVKCGESLDFIISNPPYIPTGQLTRLPSDVKREPRLALDGGDDGLTYYRTIIEHAWRILKNTGFLMMEIGDGQRPGVESIFSQYPQYVKIEFYKDYVGTNRIVAAQLNATWKN